MADIDYDRLAEAINRGRRYSGTMRSSSSDDDQVDYVQLAKEARTSAAMFSKLNVGMRFTAKAQSEYAQAAGDVRRALSEVEHALYQHKIGNKALTDSEKRLLEAERKRLQGMVDSEAAVGRFQSGVTQVYGFLTNYGSQMIAGQAAVASAIQSGASGFTIAGAQMEANAQLTNLATQAMAGGMSTAGAALMSFGGVLGKVAGGALFVYAEHLKMTSTLETQATLARNRILLQGGEQLLKSYQQATAAGAVFSNGVGKMLQSLEGSRYTIDDYSEIVKNNTENLTRMNVGVAEASLMIGKVGKVLKDQKLDIQLLRLGYSFQDQAGLAIEVMANMRKTDPTARINELEVAKRTKEYATDLKVLQEITGKNAKAEMEKNRQFTGELAFQNFLQTLGPNAERVSAAMGILPDAVKLNVKEILTLGDVQNRTGALMTSNNDALRAMQNELAAAARRGSGQEVFERILSKYAGAVDKGFLAQKDLNLAMSVQGSRYGDLNKSSQTVRDELNKWTKDTKDIRKELKDAQDKAGTPKEDPKTALLNDMVVLGQDIRKAFQDHIIKNLEKIGPELNRILEDIKTGFKMPKAPTTAEMMNDIKNKFLKMWEELPWWGKIMTGVAAALLALSAIGTLLSPLISIVKFLQNRFPGSLPPAPGSPGGRTPSGGNRPGPGGRTSPNAPGGNLPSGSGGRTPSGPGGNIPGGPQSLGRVGDFVVNMFKALGQGAGGLIAGILGGLATGLAALGAVAVPALKGIGVVSAAIVATGASLAAAAWLLGKGLPVLADGLKRMQEVDGKRLVETAKGVGAIGGALAVFGTTAIYGTAASGISQLGDSIIRFFGGEGMEEKWKKMAALGPELGAGAKGIKEFADAIKAMTNAPIDQIKVLADSLAKLKESVREPGFFETAAIGLGNMMKGMLPQGWIDQANKNSGTAPGGGISLGGKFHTDGKQIVWSQLFPDDMNYLIRNISGRDLGSIIPYKIDSTKDIEAARRAREVLEKNPKNVYLSEARLQEMAKTDPQLKALLEILQAGKDTAAATGRLEMYMETSLKMEEEAARTQKRIARYLK